MKYCALTVALLLTTAFARPACAEEAARLPRAAQGAIVNKKKDGANKWIDRHEKRVAKMKADENKAYDFVLIGDSITDFWEHKRKGASVWQKAFGDKRTLYCGVMGDQTQNVIWRLENGAIDGIEAKVVQILIGTNNRRDSAEDTVAGVRRVVEIVQAKLPRARIVLFGILPRSDPKRLKGDLEGEKAKRLKMNPLLEAFAKEKGIVYKDIGAKFLSEDGLHVRTDLMPDELHPNTAGYEVWMNEVKDLYSGRL